MVLCVPSSGCLVFCLCLSVLTLLLQGLWVPLEMSSDEPAGRSPEEQGNLRASRTHMALLWSGPLVKISVKKGALYTIRGGSGPSSDSYGFCGQDNTADEFNSLQNASF